MPKVDSATLLAPNAPKIGSIEFDCALSETHIWPSQVTRIPVESGSLRAQHIIKLPRILIIEAVISEIPFDPARQRIAASFNIAQSAVTGYTNTIPGLAALRNQAWSKFQGVSGVAKNFGGAFNPAQSVGIATAARALVSGPPKYSASDRFKTALSRMLALRESDVPFDYISPLGVVTNLVFEDLEIPVDQTGDFLFRARMVEFVETGLTRSRSLAAGQEDASGEAANIGSRSTVETEFQGLLAS